MYPVGYRLSALTRDECFKLEPALENLSAEFQAKLVGAVFKEEEQIADPVPFSQGPIVEMSALLLFLTLALSSP